MRMQTILAVLGATGILIGLGAGVTGCATGGAGSSPENVTGTVWYRERIALPPNSRVEVKLLDVSVAGAPSTVIGEQIITSPSSMPVKFSIRYDASKIQEDRGYSVSARIINGNYLLWSSDGSHPVITQGNPTNVDVLVVRATP